MAVHMIDGFLFKGALSGVDIVKGLTTKHGAAQQFTYNNLLGTEPNIASAARALRPLIHDGDACVGVSMGAQVLCRLLRDMGSDPGLGNVEFVLLANPEHHVTGRIRAAAYGGLGIPAWTPYPVTDLACQYDYWADAPTSKGWAAQLNSAIEGNAIHTFAYFHATLENPCVQIGSVRHMWAPGKPWFGIPRAQVESSYARPVAL